VTESYCIAIVIVSLDDSSTGATYVDIISISNTNIVQLDLVSRDAQSTSITRSCLCNLQSTLVLSHLVSLSLSLLLIPRITHNSNRNPRFILIRINIVF
jgi:hypothetical protein